MNPQDQTRDPFILPASLLTPGWAAASRPSIDFAYLAEVGKGGFA